MIPHDFSSFSFFRHSCKISRFFKSSTTSAQKEWRRGFGRVRGPWNDTTIRAWSSKRICGSRLHQLPTCVSGTEEMVQTTNLDVRTAHATPFGTDSWRLKICTIYIWLRHFFCCTDDRSHFLAWTTCLRSFRDSFRPGTETTLSTLMWMRSTSSIRTVIPLCI